MGKGEIVTVFFLGGKEAITVHTYKKQIICQLYSKVTAHKI